MKTNRCEHCGEPILWARVFGGKKWIPLEPIIFGSATERDFPLNSVIFDEDEGAICFLIEHESQASDMAELHRHHGDVCSKTS